MKQIIHAQQMHLMIQRLAHQVLENHHSSEDMVVIGLQPRGVYFSDRLVQELRRIQPRRKFYYGKLDITFYRDDFRKEILVPNQTEIDFSIENKQVVLVDDVLYTGRTIRAALDALLDYGRPASVELCVLIDRRFSRQLPVQPDYTGKSIDSIITQKVKVLWSERDGTDEVVLLEDSRNMPSGEVTDSRFIP